MYCLMDYKSNLFKVLLRRQKSLNYERDTYEVFG